MASKEALKFVVFLGTVREGNYGSRAAKFVVRKLEEKGYSVTLLDPDKLDFPLLKKPIHFYKERSEAPKLLQDTVKVIEAADAFVTLTAEYNHSMPPALTNMIDHFPISAFKYRPAGIVCYSAGSFGGVRAAMQARMLHGEIGTPTVQSLFAIPQIQHALSPEGEPLNEHMDKGADKLITELSWYAQALKNHRDTVGIPK